MINQNLMMNNKNNNPLQKQQQMQALQMMQNIQNQAMVMMQQQVMKQQEIENKLKEEELENIINITFNYIDEISFLSKKITIQCKLNDKIRNVIEIFEKKTNNINKNNEFIFNTFRLNPDLTVAEAGLIEGDIITVIEKGALKGGLNLI